MYAGHWWIFTWWCVLTNTVIRKIFVLRNVRVKKFSCSILINSHSITYYICLHYFVCLIFVVFDDDKILLATKIPVLWYTNLPNGSLKVFFWLSNKFIPFSPKAIKGKAPAKLCGAENQPVHLHGSKQGQL